MHHKRWRLYLLARKFIIRTDYHPLKCILEQKIATPAQHKWLSKFLGYNHKIVYKKGSKNSVADALSRIFSGGDLLTIYFPIFPLLNDIARDYEKDSHIRKVRQNMNAIPSALGNYYKGRILYC